jgi:Ca2+-binding EF-hand superfamily protein
VKHITKFPNGRDFLDFDEFIDMIKESCTDSEQAENYLVLAFSMFDIEK